MVAVHMPENTAYFQEHVTVTEPGSVTYAGGELVWPGEDGSSGGSVSRLGDENIIFIVDNRNRQSSRAGRGKSN